jgi:hypothetical protein
MPYLQLDVPNRYGTEQKQRLARRFGEIYAHIMQANIRRYLCRHPRAPGRRDLVLHGR